MYRSFLLFCLLFASCRKIYPPRGEYITGTITISEELFPKVRHPNTVLFIIARNHGEIPLAVRRIINPDFPLPYTLGREDMMLPGARWRGPFAVTARIDRDGVAGPPEAGDFLGAYPKPVQVGDSRVNIEIKNVFPGAPRPLSLLSSMRSGPARRRGPSAETTPAVSSAAPAGDSSPASPIPPCGVSGSPCETTPSPRGEGSSVPGVETGPQTP